MEPNLTFVGGDYDLTDALASGGVEPKGASLNVITYPSPERHWRMLINGEFDVCEMSMGSYLASRSMTDEYPFTAIPVFPHRRFRHSYMFKPEGADIEDPGDLDGADVGIKNWQNTAGIWMRGIAAEQYGLDLGSVTWHREVSEEVPVETGGYDVRDLPDGQDVDAALAAGDLDAAFHPVLLPSVKSGDGAERIFADSRAVEQDYYEETGIFPIMHVVVIHDDVLDEEPWLAVNLLDAFTEARDDCLEKLEDPRWTALAWARQHLEHQQDVLGENPWPYGLTEGNVRVLNTFQEYAERMNLVPRTYDMDELFAGSTLAEAERSARADIGEQITDTGE